jgi:adenine-specific DNA-methyltransferase
MIQGFLSKDDIIEGKLLNALVSYFTHENNKLGLDISDIHIETICKVLLYGNEVIDFSWQISEKTMLHEYIKEEVGIIDHLHLISTELRKQLGQYSTPSNIVRYILKSVKYNPASDILHKRLIDPACGSGAFLAEAVRIYLHSLKKAGIPIYKWYPMVISAVSGIDIDPKSCFFARLNLAMLLAPAVLEYVERHGTETLGPLPVYCADTLQLIASEMKGSGLFYSQQNVTLKGQLDFVVGNPPYFKIKDLNDELKNAFSDSIYGHPNAYGLFIHAGIEMLKEKGRMGFIVPRSMLSGLYFKNLRSLIENRSTVREIVYLSERKDVFDNVLQGTMILSIERNKHRKKTVDVSFSQSLRDKAVPDSTVNIESNKLIQRLNGTTVWFVADSHEMYDIIDRIIKKHPLLSSDEINCRAKTGQIVWNRVKPLLTTKTEKNTLPLVWSTDIGKFDFSFNKMGSARPCYLKVDSKTENFIVKGPCIFVQRITADEQPSRIVACIAEEFYAKQERGYFVENHLNIIQPTGNASADLYFILGVLNSEIVEFFFRAMNGNTQVSATELNLLPMPSGRYESDISKTARAIQKSNAGNIRNKLIFELNELVAKAYGLSRKEFEFINRFLIGRRKNDA